MEHSALLKYKASSLQFCPEGTITTTSKEQLRFHKYQCENVNCKVSKLAVSLNIVLCKKSPGCIKMFKLCFVLVAALCCLPECIGMKELKSVFQIRICFIPSHPYDIMQSHPMYIVLSRRRLHTS